MADEKSKNSYGIKELCEEEGVSEMKMLEQATSNSVVPAICTNCGAIYEYEPDCIDGFCDECETNSVQSCLVLAGII